jgi:hypothetical protein
VQFFKGGVEARPGDDTRFRVSIRIETSIGIRSVRSIQYQYLTDTA